MDNDTTAINFTVAESRHRGNSSEDDDANVINAASDVTIIYLVIGN